MAQPDLPNFTWLGRIVVGAIALGMIYVILRVWGYFPA